MITAGKKSEVHWGKGNWAFLDIGFSNNRPSCGFVFADDPPKNLRYGEARRAIVDLILRHNSTMNLVIEAPLSVCFDADRNPKGRIMEKQGSRTRYWYNGLGCAVLTAATYLIRDIYEATTSLPNVNVHHFEGFVSFKEGGTDHKKDACELRKRVREAPLNNGSIYDSDELRLCESDQICSALCVAGLDYGVPAVIIA